jgi:uncharacterized membrane protein YjfL (UPF0719 family)
VEHFGWHLWAAAGAGLSLADRWEIFGWQLLMLWAFGLSGIALLFIGYWLFDKLTPGVHFTREIVDKENKAVAIVIGSILLGIALIVSATLIG